MRLFLILTLLFATCRAVITSLESKNYFKDVTNEIQTCVSSGNGGLKKLALFNLDSLRIMTFDLILEPDVLQEYIEANKKISGMIYENNIFDLKSNEVLEFVDHLVEAIGTFLDLFGRSEIENVVNVILASGTVNPKNEIKYLKALEKLIPKLKELQKMRLLTAYKKNISTEICLITGDIVKKDFYNNERISKFLDEYIRLISVPMSSEKVFKTLCTLLISPTAIWIDYTPRVYEFLLLGLKYIQNSLEIDQIIEFIKTINIIMPKIISDPNLVNILIDVIFGDAFVNSLDGNVVDKDYLEILFKCNEAQKHFFKSRLNETSDKLKAYKERLKIYDILNYYLKQFAKLNSDSNEAEFEIALNFVITVKKICITTPEALQCIPNIYKTIRSMLFTLKYIATAFPRSNLITISKIIFHSATFMFEKSEESDKEIFAENIAFGLGHIMLFTQNSSNHPNELIIEVLPEIEEIINLLVKHVHQSKTPILLVEILAYTKFVYLHPTKDSLSIASQLCYDLILSHPLDMMGYFYIKDVEFIETDLIIKAGFMHFIAEFLHHPNYSDMFYLKHYFEYLKSAKILSKTEEILITIFFN